MNGILSREKSISEIYLKIAGIVEPGDLIFFITHNPYKFLTDEISNENWRTAIRSRLMPWWRQWLGFDRDDLGDWHVGIFFMTRKRKHHRRTNFMAHSFNIKKWSSY
jgi:hypothetical protein